MIAGGTHRKRNSWECSVLVQYRPEVCVCPPSITNSETLYIELLSQMRGFQRPGSETDLHPGGHVGCGSWLLDAQNLLCIQLGMSWGKTRCSVPADVIWCLFLWAMRNQQDHFGRPGPEPPVLFSLPLKALSVGPQSGFHVFPAEGE